MGEAAPRTGGGTWYIVVICLLATVSAGAQGYLLWLMSQFLLIWLVALAGAYALATAVALLFGRGYGLAMCFPLCALPLWVPSVITVAGIVGLLLNGMEGSRTDSLLDTLMYVAVAIALHVQVWTLLHLPIWLILRTPEVRAEQQPLLALPAGARAGLLLALVIVVAGLVAFLPVGQRQERLIHVAAEKGWTPVVGGLLRLGAPVDARTGEDRHTPLHDAVDAHQDGTIVFLLDHGADPNAADHRGWTALHHAVNGYADREAARLLITHGANVNARDDTGKTPLFYARQWHHEDIIDLLLRHGAEE